MNVRFQLILSEEDHGYGKHIGTAATKNWGGAVPETSVRALPPKVSAPVKFVLSRNGAIKR